MNLKALLSAVLTLGAIQVANAGLVTFDFAGGGPNANSITFSSGAVDLVANGYDYDGSSDTLSAERITWNRNGLGIRGNGSGQVNVPNDAFDAEIIEFILPAGATWHSIAFWNLGNNDEAAYGDFFGGITTVNGSGAANPQTVDISALGNLSELDVFAQNGFEKGKFRIRSITVEIPGPAVLVLFGTGLIGLGLFRRFKR